MQPLRRRNTRIVFWLVLGLIALIAIYSSIFHEIMEYEGRSYSWATGIYWTLTVMSTLGFGDITFESDLGRIFSVVVLISGAMFILVLLPFVFIQFIFMPWMARRDANRTPSRVDDNVSGHVILTGLSDVTEAIILRVKAMKLRYVLIVASHVDAIALSDRGYDVMVGPLDDPSTYRAARADHAAMVVATRSDMTNTNIVFTVRELGADILTVATASSTSATEILTKAGCDSVVQLGDLLGRAMARRVLGRDGRSRVIGSFGDLLVAEAAAIGTSLATKTIKATGLRTTCQVNIAGLWQHGTFEIPRPETIIDPTDVLVLVGSREQLDRYDEQYAHANPDTNHVVIVGGGRVGRAAARALAHEGVSYRIIDKLPERVAKIEHGILGDAADLAVLEQAGFEDASAILITTHDDDFNIYLTIYCSQIAPDLPVIARSNRESNVATLNRADAESVLSYASLGAAAILNSLGGDDSLVLAEGLEMFSTPMPQSLVGKSFSSARVGELTGCNVVAMTRNGHTEPNPDPHGALPADASLVVIGDVASQKRFLERFPADPTKRISRRQPRV